MKKNQKKYRHRKIFSVLCTAFKIFFQWCSREVFMKIVVLSDFESKDAVCLINHPFDVYQYSPACLITSKIN